MAEASDTKTVTISNVGSGPRYVHSVDGPVVIRRGETRVDVEVRTAELDALPAGLQLGEVSADQSEEIAGDGDETGGPRSWPSDLAADTSDGLILRDALIQIAKDEGADFKTDADKVTIANAIVAKRLAGAGATDGPTG